MTLYEIAMLDKPIKFKFNGLEYIFNLEGKLETIPHGKLAVLNRNMAISNELELLCGHPLDRIEGSVNRIAYLGFELRCRQCNQEVEVDTVKTKLFTAVTPKTIPPPPPDLFPELSDEDKKTIHDFVSRSVDRQNKEQPPLATMLPNPK